MKRKLTIAGIACGFIVISGICYSCAYQKDNPASLLVSEEIGKKEGALEMEASKGKLNTQDIPGSITEAIIDTDQKNTVIYVHICGAVATPGVYKLKSDARLCELIEQSGGLLQDAAGDYVNQAQQVMDGQRIYIPTKEEVEGLSTAAYLEGDQNVTEKEEETSTLVNINTADSQELMNLPGIGQAKADSIIEYRTTNGTFKTIEELMKIPGIKEGLFSKISAYIVAE